MSETKKVWKLFWAWEFEKEERWLNEMVSNGWALSKVGLANYTFEKCEPNEYIIRLEYHEHDNNYITFMEETGAKCIGNYNNWLYFRRNTLLGSFDIFSDLDSRVNHLDKISKLLFAIGMINIAFGMHNLNHGIELAWINLLLSAFIMYGLGRIHGKKENLEEERKLHE